RLVGDVDDVRGDAQALRQLAGLAQPLGFGHVLRRDVAHRDVAAFGDELTGELAPHARAAPGDDGNLAREVFHGADLPCPFCASLAHVPEKWTPVFREGHAQTNESAKYGNTRRPAAPGPEARSRIARPIRFKIPLRSPLVGDATLDVKCVD